MPRIQNIANNGTVEMVMVDMCAHGMSGKDSDGSEKPIMKPTRIMTNPRR